MKQLLAYELDLTTIKGYGDFPCPKCGVIISPEDETEEVYCILETKVRSQNLEEVVNPWHFKQLKYNLILPKYWHVLPTGVSNKHRP